MRYRKSIAVALGFVFVFGSLGVPARVTTLGELQAVEFGLPFKFVIQDQSRYDPPPESFPRKFNLVSPWEAPMKVHWLLLVASLTTSIFAAAAAIGTLSKLVRTFHPNHPEASIMDKGTK